MSYRKLGTFTTASDAIGCHATPTAGAPHWRGKVGLVKGVYDGTNKLNPLMRIDFEWDIEGRQLPHKEQWQMPLLSLGHVKGFVREIQKFQDKETEKFIAEMGSLDIGNLEVSMTCEICAMPFDPDPQDLTSKTCPQCKEEFKHEKV